MRDLGSVQTTSGNPFEAIPNRDDLISGLRAIKQEWRDSLGIEEMGSSAPSHGAV